MLLEDRFQHLAEAEGLFLVAWDKIPPHERLGELRLTQTSQSIEPGPVTPMHSQQVEEISNALRKAYGEPFEMIPYLDNDNLGMGSFACLTKHIFRFTPFSAGPQISHAAQSVKTYREIIQLCM